jgi:RNA methyltransferase, TrmH family
MLIPETITSASNPLLKEVRKAVARGTLSAEGWCVAESMHLLEEALRSPCEVKTVLAAESKRAQVEALGRRLAAAKLFLLRDALFDGISATESSQGVMALVKPRAWEFEQLLQGNALVVVLEGIQDPGNAGAMVRAAEAFGGSGVLFLKGTVSPYNPKTLRAAAGSLFRVPFLEGMASATSIATLRKNGIKLFAAMPSARTTADSLAAADLTCRCGLIIGSEAHGVGPEWRAAAAHVSIPTVGVESLNASLAAGILLYEARRQRMMHR